MQNSFRVDQLKTKIAILKFIDRFVGGVVVRLLPKPQLCPFLPVPRSFLVIRPGGIGDVVHLAPFLQRLHENFPSAHITLLAEKRNAGVTELIPVELTVLRYDRPQEFIRALRGRYDVVIDTEQWHFLSAIVARLVRAPMKIGFATNKRFRLFTHTIPYSHDAYEADLFLSLLTPIGIISGHEFEKPWLVIPRDVEVKTRSFFHQLVEHYVVVFPGASIPERRWRRENFRSLSLALCEEGRQVVVVGSREDCTAAAMICQGGVGFDFAGMTTLAESAALIAKADLLVCGDSGLLHVGVGLGIPTVSLFGPGIPKKWGPQGGQHLILNLHLPCSPCTCYGTTPDCRYQAECMNGISVDAVICAVKKQLIQDGID